MKKIFLDIGCGYKKPEGSSEIEWVGLDIRDFPGVDHVLNIGKDKFPIEDNSVDFIQSIHVFEHLYPEELFHCIEECWRVLKPQGKIHIEVPKAGTPAYYIHPDHKIQYVEDTFGFFQVPGNERNEDPHGYLKGFWHVDVLKDHDNKQAVHVDMYPNKPEGKFPYVEVKHPFDNIA